MTPHPQQSDPASEPPPSNGWRTFGIIVITIVLTLAASYWILSSHVFRTGFVPVELDAAEKRQLDAKLNRLQARPPPPRPPMGVRPQRYSEANASREITFTEKELNALLARNTDLANRLAIDLSDNLASANLLVPLEPDFPVLGGKTVRVSAGMELGVINGRPRAVLKGVSLWGVPLPNAWLGNMKDVDLIRTFGEAGGFWQAVNDGVEVIEVSEGRLRIQLKE